MPSKLADTATVDVVPVKSNALNHDPSVNVRIDAPLVIDKFGAVPALPEVLPIVNVLVTDASVTNLPVPVNAVFNVGIFNTTVAGVGSAKMILVVPNATVLLPNVGVRLVGGLKEPTVKLYPPKSNVPLPI